MNVEGKLAKVLEKEDGVLVIRASERDKVLEEISARAARVERYDPEGAERLIALRAEVKESFNKGQPPSNDMMEELYFLDPRTQELVEKMSRHYDKTVTPDDFKEIAGIMSEHLASRVPILKDFTKFFGRLSEAYLTTAKPKNAELSLTELFKKLVFDERAEKKPPKMLVRILGLRNQTYREALLRRIPLWDKDSLFDNWMFGVSPPKTRRTGYKVGGVSIMSEDIIPGYEILYPNKMEKSWTRVPWVNFDGKVVEQHFTHTIEEKLVYKNAAGEWQTNIVQVKQKTDPSWWEEIRNKDGKINEIADTQKARTAFAVNGNHSNDATVVKNFHRWGRRKNVATTTIHDAFFTNVADMRQGKDALRQIYADSLRRNSIEETLLEMKRRGMPDDVYQAYRNEAIDTGLIPVAGRSRVGGKLLTKEDILTEDDILQEVDTEFRENRSWYGIG